MKRPDEKGEAGGGGGSGDGGGKQFHVRSPRAKCARVPMYIRPLRGV
jgi:hypothetical protein